MWIAQYNKTIVTNFRHFVSNGQHECDIVDQPLTFVRYKQANKSDIATSFSVDLSRNAFVLLPTDSDTALSSDMQNSAKTQPLRTGLLAHVNALHFQEIAWPTLSQA